MRIIFLQNVSK